MKHVADGGLQRSASGLYVPEALARPSTPAAPPAPTPAVALRVVEFEHPEPSPDVLRVLAAWNDRWFMQFSRFPQPHFDVCERWRPDDPKRERIARGEIPETADFDVIAYCPTELSAEESLSYIEQRLVRFDDNRDRDRYVEQTQADLAKANADTRAARKMEFRIELEHQNKHMTSHEANLLAGATSAHTMIQGATLTTE